VPDEHESDGKPMQLDAEARSIAIGIVGFAAAQRTKALVSGRALGRSGDFYAVTGVVAAPAKRRHVRTLGSRVDVRWSRGPTLLRVP
jgi:hypothetical protein